MTAKAYVLIETEVGKAREVIESIRGLEGVASVDAITGPYDAVAVLRAETSTDIGNLVADKLHLITGISRTLTCLVWGR